MYCFEKKNKSKFKEKKVHKFYHLNQFYTEMYSVLYKSHLFSNKLLIVFVSSIYYHEFPFTCPGI